MMDENKLLFRLLNAAKIIDKSFRYICYREEIPAMSWGLIYKNFVYTNGFHLNNKNESIQLNNKSCYRIGSISKIFTAIAILQLVEQGKLKLDDYLIQYLPWFKSINDDRVNKITVRSLLIHSSGLSKDGNFGHWNTNVFPSFLQLKKYLQYTKLCFTPNEKHKYSNIGYAYLGELIRVLSKSSYEEYIQEKIIKRMNLSHTSPIITEEIKSDLVFGFGRKLPNKKRIKFPIIETKAFTPCVGFFSNVEDLIKLISFLFSDDDKVLKKESKQEFFRIQWRGMQEKFNQALTLQNWKIENNEIYSHIGIFKGYKSAIALNQENKIGIVIIINVIDVSVIELIKTAFHTILSSIDYKNIKKKDNIKLSNYEGIFSNDWGEVEVVEFDNHLIIYNADAKKPLLNCDKLDYLGNNNFLITEGNNLGKFGEIVRFDVNKSKKTKCIYIGSSRMRKFNINNYVLDINKTI